MNLLQLGIIRVRDDCVPHKIVRHIIFMSSRSRILDVSVLNMAVKIGAKGVVELDLI
jgi:hypothetical protein